ncbi:MAG: hypothetical protein K2M68_04840 [Muribaculaceae bacterium]|nr:hypothetical protein [Muribaculaceae bacterium]
MKKIVLTVATMFAIVAGVGFDASAKEVVPPAPVMTGGVGPAVAGSTAVASLPKHARKIIEKLGLDVLSCEHEYDDNTYDVKTASGLELEFYANGDLKEIEAESGTAIGSDMIRDIVPKHMYDKLNEMNIQIVKSIEINKNGYKVDYMSMSGFNGAFFNHDGQLVAQYYD